MTLYQVRDNKTGLYYKRHHGRHGEQWVKQDEASIWTTREGAQACLGSIRRYNSNAKFRGRKTREPEIVTLHTLTGTVAFVDGDDWQGLYIDGKLVQEGHCVRIDEVFHHLGINGVCYYADDAWLAERGRLPENLEELETA